MFLPPPLDVPYSADDFEAFVQWMKAHMEKLKTGHLAKLDTRGCKLILGIRPHFPEQILTVSYNPSL